LNTPTFTKAIQKLQQPIQQEHIMGQMRIHPYPSMPYYKSYVPIQAYQMPSHPVYPPYFQRTGPIHDRFTGLRARPENIRRPIAVAQNPAPRGSK
jgi:hypothetical protein